MGSKLKSIEFLCTAGLEFTVKRFDSVPRLDAKERRETIYCGLPHVCNPPSHGFSIERAATSHGDSPERQALWRNPVHTPWLDDVCFRKWIRFDTPPS
jgi:hypothetical protein